MTTTAFLVRRHNVELLVVLRPSGLVNMEPYQCKAENLRLWTVIAKTQMVWAQAQLANDKDKNSAAVLPACFQKSGWEVTELEARKERSV
jgi:hypothetical protein